MTGRRATASAARRRSSFRRTAKPVDPRNRLVALLVAFIIVGAGLMAVLVDFQTVRGERYRDLGEDQTVRTRSIAGYRGSIVDRNGFVLAATTPSHQIVADPTMITHPAVTANLLAPVLGLDEAALADLLVPDSDNDHYALLARDVDDEVVSRIQAIDSGDDSDHLDGISILPEQDRIYPAGDLAVGVVGRVDPDEQGIFGIEQLYDQQMTGTAGTEQYERSAFGTISVGDWKVDPATTGDTVTLTIDQRVQYMAEQALLAECAENGAKGLTAIMSRPATGEVLAMASVVRDDAGACVVPRYNTAVVNVYEPGSVMKPFVVAAVTDQMGYTSDTMVEVPSRLTIGGKAFVDHPAHAPAPFPISQILADSMNVGTIVLSQQIPAQTYVDYLQRFGFTQSSGLPVAGEAAGSVRDPADWFGSDFGSIPIGQGLTVNAAQLLTAYAAIANDGVLVPLTLVQSITAADGTQQGPDRVEPRTVVAAAAADEVTRSLVAVVADGTGSPAAVPGYTVAGKTGTAWKVFDDGTGTMTYGSDGNRRYMLSFAGFLPADDPEIALVVVVDEPESTNVLGEATASEFAAPLFADIADAAVNILGILPEDLDEVAAGDGRVRAEPAGQPLAPTPPSPSGASVTGGVAEDTTAENAADTERDESEQP